MVEQNPQNLRGIKFIGQATFQYFSVKVS